LAGLTPQTKKATQAAYYQRHREAIRKRQAQYRANNPKRVFEGMRKAHLKHAYGITPEEADAILSRGCGICGRPATCIDHDHDTGVVRGGLCNSCNSGLGKLGDSIVGLRRALDYLVKAKVTKCPA